MDASRYKKLKVAELREILESRGESFKGLKKDELVQKCLESTDAEGKVYYEVLSKSVGFLPAV